MGGIITSRRDDETKRSAQLSEGNGRIVGYSVRKARAMVKPPRRVRMSGRDARIAC